MTPWFPPPALLGAFVLASLVLALTPGPGVLYIVTRSLSSGRRWGLASVAGVALGNLGNALGASIGLAALFGASSLAFSVVRWVGAVYLIMLGVQALRAPAAGAALPVVRQATLMRALRDGFWVALLNPKTTLFFAAFLPQFMGASPSMSRSVALGTLFVAIAASTDTAYALAAGLLRSWLSGASAWRGAGRWLSGGVLIGLGVLTAFTGRAAQR